MANRLDAYVDFIKYYDGPPVKLMEVCGTHTHQISHFGVQSLLNDRVTLISGPGCPVCVTPSGYIDRAAQLALQKDACVLSFGDMLRVPGVYTTLNQAKAEGGRVQMMYSPMDAVGLAQKEPNTLFYIAAVGFETTLPLYALLLKTLEEKQIQNVRLFLSVKALMPGLHWLCQTTPDIDGFIGPGHVSAVIGSGAYEAFCAQYRIPLVVAGFSYEHLVLALHDLLIQKLNHTFEARNLYPAVVRREGNPEALALIDRYFTLGRSVWRGLGAIDGSGYQIRGAYEAYDAGGYDETGHDAAGCLCAKVITGRARPVDCPYYGKACTPLKPVGPCMVSTEGTCGIWYQNARTK